MELEALDLVIHVVNVHGYIYTFSHHFQQARTKVQEEFLLSPNLILTLS